MTPLQNTIANGIPIGTYQTKHTVLTPLFQIIFKTSTSNFHSEHKMTIILSFLVLRTVTVS